MGRRTLNEGHPPSFIAKHVCPVQHANHCAATKHSSQLHKLHGRIHIRRSRRFRSEQDRFVLRQTYHPARRGLEQLGAPVTWPSLHELNLAHIQEAKNWVVASINEHTLQTKQMRIHKWKSRLKQSSTSGCAYIFLRLRSSPCPR